MGVAHARAGWTTASFALLAATLVAAPARADEPEGAGPTVDEAVEEPAPTLDEPAGEVAPKPHTDEPRVPTEDEDPFAPELPEQEVPSTTAFDGAPVEGTLIFPAIDGRPLERWRGDGSPALLSDGGSYFVPAHIPFNVALVHPIAINATSPNSWTHFDLSLVVSRVGVLDGVGLGLINWVGYRLRGVQLGLAGVVGTNAEALQVNGAFSMVDFDFEGLQMAGLFSWSNTVQGVQLSGIGSHTARDLRGVQAAGVFNVLRKDLEGMQVAGAVNIGRVDGIQIAPINVSQRARGLQIGVFNVAKKIDGLQIGVVNVTYDLEGESLGIIPLPRKGGIHLAVWGSNTLFGNVGVKFASRYAYSILSASIGSETVDNQKDTVYAGGLTMGAQVAVGSGFRVAGDLGVHRRFRDGQTPDFTRSDELYKLRLIGSYALAKRMAPFLGAGGFVSVREEDEADGGNVEGDFGPEMFLGIEF